MGFLSQLFSRKSADTSDNILLVNNEEKGMKAAILKAQETFPEFLEELKIELERETPAFEECYLKYGFEIGKTKKGPFYEHMFIAEPQYDGTQLTGTLASIPQQAEGVNGGDTIVIDPKLVSDWMYVKNGKGYGGFTFIHIFNNELSSDEQEELAQISPYCYLVNQN